MKNTWHSADMKSLWELTGSGEEGLTAEEVSRRLGKHGRNALEAAEGPSAFKTIRDQVHNPLIYLLIGAAGLSLATGHSIDAAVIGAVIVLNTILGAVQELKADRALEALRLMAVPHARVIRNGEAVTVSSEEIVPGDVLKLSTGDRVPADARLFSSVDLYADESALTGESEPVHKTPGEVPPGTQPADRVNMLWMSSAITRGNGLAVVVDTGMNTQLGRIAGSVRETERGKTPLQKRLSRLGLVLGVSGMGLSGVIFLLGLLQGHSPSEMALFAIAVAVSAIPEGLPAVISVTLALGVQRMAGKNAVVRTLPAVETLGSTTVICSDKTGTITRNRMTVTHGWTAAGEMTVDAEGFHGTSDDGELGILLRCGVLANNATVTSAGAYEGSPTESAVLASSIHGGLDPAGTRKAFPRKDEIPFSSSRKYMAVLCGDSRLYLMGAADRVLGFSSRILEGGSPGEITPERREMIEEQIEAMASKGLRVLAGAFRDLGGNPVSITEDDAENELVFAGLWGMVDPPRPEAVEAVAAAGGAGIRVVMITGDHAVTARAIAASAGIAAAGARVITGAELDGMDQSALEGLAGEVSVFARVTPQHKLRILQALKSRGEIVAMTGDGVNDAPALKGADIGIAMGKTGTEVAREAADMILTDDDFATIVEAVEEGRTIFSNLRRVVFFLITTNLGEILTLATGLALGMPLPLTAVMILWINLVTDGACTIPLGIEPGHGSVLRQKPRPPSEGILGGGFLKRIFIFAPMMAAGTLFLFSRELAGGEVHARTMAFNALAAFQWFQAVSSRSLTSSVFSVGFFRNKWLWAGILASVVLQVLVTQTGIGQAIFGVQALSASNWLWITAVASSVLVVDELLKIMKFYGNRNG